MKLFSWNGDIRCSCLCCLHTKIYIHFYLVNINRIYMWQRCHVWMSKDMGISNIYMFFTHRLLYSWNDPPSNKRILANSTALRNGTSTNSSKCNSTANLNFFFRIINAIPGAPGPINVIHETNASVLVVRLIHTYTKGIFSLFRIRYGLEGAAIMRAPHYYALTCIYVSGLMGTDRYVVGCARYVCVPRQLLWRTEYGSINCLAVLLR